MSWGIDKVFNLTQGTKKIKKDKTLPFGALIKW
jgi:hypothetical protein